MLVVTIIIAAVVSGFAGSLVGGNAERTPSLSMDIKIINTGFYTSSAFVATVTGVSEPIPTKDLRIITSWRARDGTTGGNTTIAGGQNFNCVPNGSGNDAIRSSSPWGFGTICINLKCLVH